MKDRVANAEFTRSFLRKRHQPLGQSLAAVLGLDEEVEDERGDGRPDGSDQQPIDHHHTEARDHDACILEHPAKIAGVIESR